MKKKVQLTAKEKEVIKEEMKAALRLSANEREQVIARMIGDVYDVELPIPEVVSAIARVERAAPGEHVYYLAPDTITKTVNTLTSNCNITQTKVTPNSRTELTWTDLVSPEYYVCLQDWLQGDHDVLAFYANAISEAMNRQEVYATLALASAGAVSESNTYTLDSGKTKFDFPKLVEMARSVAKYGSNLVLITGSNVTTDVMLMDYDADKNREVSVSDIVDTHIKIEDVSVTIDSSATDVIGANEAYLVAVSDASQNKPILFARRSIAELAATNPNAEAQAKERIIIDSPAPINVGSDRKLARAKVGFEEYGAVAINDKAFAKFTRS